MFVKRNQTETSAAEKCLNSSGVITSSAKLLVNSEPHVVKVGDCQSRLNTFLENSIIPIRLIRIEIVRCIIIATQVECCQFSGSTNNMVALQRARAVGLVLGLTANADLCGEECHGAWARSEVDCLCSINLSQISLKPIRPCSVRLLPQVMNNFIPHFAN